MTDQAAVTATTAANKKMSNMRTQLRGFVLATILLGFASSTNGVAETFTKADGEVLEGSIDYLNDSEVTIKTSGDEFVSASISSFDEASVSKIKEWAQSHPDLSGVYAAWDVKPSVVRSRVATIPPGLNSPGFKGIVSLQVILDEDGKVSHATVNKSTHRDLEDAAMDAIRKWSFKPAEVAGQNVKARIAISFKFEA